MSDVKRTFLTGMLIAGVLMIIPWYYNALGISNNDQSDSEVMALPEQLPQNNTQISEKKTAPIKQTLSVKKTYQEFQIINNNFTATVSNLSGGSVVEYVLNSDESQYVGGYDDAGLYRDATPVSLILNTSNLCAPCVQFQDLNGNTSVVDEPFQLISPAINSSNVFIVEKDSPAVLVFRVSLNNLEITKTLTITYNKFVINHSVDVKTLNSNSPSAIGFVWDKGIRNTEYNVVDEISYSLASIGSNKNIENITLSPSSIEDRVNLKSYDDADWVALRNKYFIMAMVPDAPMKASYSAETFALNSNNLVPSFSSSILNNGDSNLNCDIYLGPLDLESINELDSYLDRIMNFGWFILQPFSRSILWLLKFLHGFGINYGVILVLFAFIIRFITGPLTKKSYESSQKMQSLQPQIQKLQEKFKKDPQRLNQETIKLYKESGTNPLGGCLPMLLQMPLLFSLFIVFRSTIEFRGAPFFGWISNLSQPDTIINLPINIPLYGDQIAFLPILLGITMFLSQKMSMASMDPKQKPFMYIMSVFFYLIFNSFPSGLNLYYVVYNLLNYLQQKSLKKAA